MDNLDVRLLSVLNEALLTCSFHLIVVSIFLKRCVKDHEDTFSRFARKKDLISMYQGAQNYYEVKLQVKSASF